jgi:hypothetical protein
LVCSDVMPKPFIYLTCKQVISIICIKQLVPINQCNPMKASPKEEEMKNIRKGLFICTMVAVAVLSSLNSAWAPDTAMRSYVSGNFFLTLNGVKCGFIKSVDGGGISAEVINEPARPVYFTKKHIGQPKYEAFEMQVGFSMTKAVYEWISQTWSWNIPRVSGSIISADYNLNAKSERQFSRALLTETTIPTMDSASKEPAYITLKFAPESTRLVKSSGKLTGDYGKNEQKVFLPSNFILKIDGLDCSKVNKIESFTVKQAAVKDNIDDSRDSQIQPGALNFPNLKITMAEVAAQSFIDWHDSFVIKGNNDDSKERHGSLTLLSPDRKIEMAKIEFFNMGIFRIQPDKAQANADQIKRLTVELYVERMTFNGQNIIVK